MSASEGRVATVEHAARTVAAWPGDRVRGVCSCGWEAPRTRRLTADALADVYEHRLSPPARSTTPAAGSS